MADKYFVGDEAWWKYSPYGGPKKGKIVKDIGGGEYLIRGAGFEAIVISSDLSRHKPSIRNSSFQNGCARAEKEIQNKLQNAGVADSHQLKVLKDTVRNPAKGMFMGGPTAEEAERILRTKFGFSDKQVQDLKK